MQYTESFNRVAVRSVNVNSENYELGVLRLLWLWHEIKLRKYREMFMWMSSRVENDGSRESESGLIALGIHKIYYVSYEK